MQGTIKAMKKDSKGFMLAEDEQWYSGRKYLNVKKGDVVEFDFKVNGNWKNIDGDVKVVGGGAPAPQQQQAPAPANNYKQNDEERQRMIIRQNALTNAVAYVLGTETKANATPEKVISIAQEFEFYTSGDMAKEGTTFNPDE